VTLTVYSHVMPGNDEEAATEFGGLMAMPEAA
jgi:hypothetical protein